MITAAGGTPVTVVLRGRARGLMGQIELPAAPKLVNLETLRKLGAQCARMVA